jgi:hypothetical protein
MKPLKIEGTDNFPRIYFDPAKGIFEIIGKSYPADGVVAYERVFNWLTDYCKAPNKQTTFDVHLIYFNSASAKILFHIFKILKEIQDSGFDVLIRWHYPDGDDDLEEAGSEIADILGLPIKLIKYQA